MTRQAKPRQDHSSQAIHIDASHVSNYVCADHACHAEWARYTDMQVFQNMRRAEIKLNISPPHTLPAFVSLQQCTGLGKQ